MPRYLFHLVSSQHVYLDDDGTDLPDLNAARTEAQKDAQDFMRARFEQLSGDWTNWAIEICDAEGHLLAVVPFVSQQN